jgi:hypothetical protein
LHYTTGAPGAPSILPRLGTVAAAESSSVEPDCTDGAIPCVPG